MHRVRTVVCFSFSSSKGVSWTRVCGYHACSLRYNPICNGSMCWSEWVGGWVLMMGVDCLMVPGHWSLNEHRRILWRIVYGDSHNPSRPLCLICHTRIFGSLMPCWSVTQRPIIPMSWRQRGDHDEATHLTDGVNITLSALQWPYYQVIDNNCGILLVLRHFNNAAHPTHDGLIIPPSTIERSYHLPHSLNHTKRMFHCFRTFYSRIHPCSLHMQYLLVPMCTYVKELGLK